MTGCLSILIVPALPILGMASLIRWFEQVTDAVDQDDWRRVSVLVVAPVLVWLYPSKISAGRPIAVPRHEPVRGFGKVSLTPGEAPKPPPPKKKRSPIDPEMVARLKAKMREQGMLEENDEG